MQEQNAKTLSMIDAAYITDDEVMKSIEISKTIASTLDRKKLLNVLRNIIDESKCITFKTERSRNFILADRPNLLLTLDIEKAKELYPDLAPDFDLTDIDEQRNLRKTIVQNEVSNKIVDFFTATFLYIKDNKYPDNYKHCKDIVMEITKDIDIAKVKNHINNFFEIPDTEGEIGFSFSITSVTGFPPDELIFSDPTVYLEVVY